MKIIENFDFSSCLGMEFTTAPSKLSSVKEFFAKFPEKPDRLSIKHFTDLQPKDLQPVSFCPTHGPEVDIYCLGKVVLRKSKSKINFNSNRNRRFVLFFIRYSSTCSTLRFHWFGDVPRWRTLSSYFVCRFEFSNAVSSTFDNEIFWRLTFFQRCFWFYQCSDSEVGTSSRESLCEWSGWSRRSMWILDYWRKCSGWKTERVRRNLYFDRSGSVKFIFRKMIDQ